VSAAAARDRWVVCYQYAAGPYTAERAGREMESIARMGLCHDDHAIVVSAVKPTVAAPDWDDDIEEVT
jgi:hypothetical protein